MSTNCLRYWPAALLLVLLSAVLARDVFHKSPPPEVAVLVQQQPEQIAAEFVQAPPTFKALVKDELPFFDPSLVTPLPVKVTIIDEKEEQPPVVPQPVQVEIRDEVQEPDSAASVTKAFDIDPRPRVAWLYGPGMRFGITALETGKRLTYAANGLTNQTLLRVNSELGEFGGPLGTFLERDVPSPPNPTAKTFGGSRSVWISGKIKYTQILELMPSKQPAVVAGKQMLLLDTVRVRYLIENKDAKFFRVGLRTQIDTLIGANDGVPFTVPGLPGLVTNFADFPRSGPLPDFIQALERPLLQNPGTVAHMSLKLGAGIEPPSRLSLTHWPIASYPNWEVPLASMASDSAVVLYWNDKPLRPGEKREMGFAYGLGSVASSEAGGKLGITLGGSFEPGQSFTVTAYVQGPMLGQTLTLELPQGLARIQGDATQKVLPPPPGAVNSIVTWQVKVLETGNFLLKVVSSNGLAQSKLISIVRPDAAPIPGLAVDLSGSFEPGQSFDVRANLEPADSASKSAPSLKLSSGLAQIHGPVVASDTPAAGKKPIAVWKIKILEQGQHSVRVEWAGATTTKSLNIVRPETPAGGYVTMKLDPPFAPGKAFSITAMVNTPLPGQTLTLHLPTGLHLIEGQEMTPVVQEKDGPTMVCWKVLVKKPGTYALKLDSSTGLSLRKTLAIEQSDTQGGTFRLDHVGDIAVGKEFTVQAIITNPATGQKLTLLPLPPGLELIDGPATKAIPLPENGLAEKTLVLTWRVRVLAQRPLSIRVASTTGMIQSFTIAFVAEQSPNGEARLFTGKR